MKDTSERGQTLADDRLFGARHGTHMIVKEAPDHPAPIGAGFLRRLSALGIDDCYLGLPLVLAGIAMDDSTPFADALAALPPRERLLGIPLFALGRGLQQARFGRTLGQSMCGLRVTALDGHRPGLAAAIGRNLILCLPRVMLLSDLTRTWDPSGDLDLVLYALVLAMAWMAVLNWPGRRSLHDLLCGTQVWHSEIPDATRLVASGRQPMLLPSLAIGSLIVPAVVLGGNELIAGLPRKPEILGELSEAIRISGGYDEVEVDLETSSDAGGVTAGGRARSGHQGSTDRWARHLHPRLAGGRRPGGTPPSVGSAPSHGLGAGRLVLPGRLGWAYARLRGLAPGREREPVSARRQARRCLRAPVGRSPNRVCRLGCARGDTMRGAGRSRRSPHPPAPPLSPSRRLRRR
jgi:uncharacterized RDD family membrane protein YckC